MSTAVVTTLEDRESGESTPVLNAIYGSAKAWVNLANTTNPISVRTSFNIIGVVDMGVGVVKILFDTPMNTGAYSGIASAWNEGVTAAFSSAPTSRTTTECIFTVVNPSGSVTNASVLCIAIFD